MMSKEGKREYCKWTQDDLDIAIRRLKAKEIGLNEAERLYNVPKKTIKRHMEGQNKRSGQRAIGREATFTSEMEKELVDHILQCEERMFGLTPTDVRRLAFQVADKFGLSSVFNAQKKTAGKKWYYGFLKRNPGLSLRQPEATSLARVKGFSRERVMAFYDILEDLVDKCSLDGSHIYNMDESGFTTVQKKQNKVLGQKGKKQIGGVTSGERGVNTTVVCCCNAAGNYVPPMIIFKRKQNPPELGDGAPVGSLVEVSDTGYINSELFVKWLKHFASLVPCSLDKPVLLLLDGHATHSKNLDALEFSKCNGIILLQLPSHTTHRMQPLDVGFFKPFSDYFVQAQETWLRANVGRTIGPFQMAKLLNEGYGRAATISTAENAFRASGVWPVNRHVFNDSHFAASEAATAPEKPFPELPNDNVHLTNQSKISPQGFLTSTPTLAPDNLTNSSPCDAHFSDILKQISPLPQAAAGNANVNASKRQNAMVLTSTPYKLQLEEAKDKIKKKDLKPGPIRRKLFDSHVPKEKRAKNNRPMGDVGLSKKKKPLKRKRAISSSDDDEDIGQEQQESPRCYDSSGLSPWDEKPSDSEDLEDEPKIQPVLRYVGEFVIVKYEGKHFPGVVVDVHGNDGADVNCMEATGRLWKWPNKADNLFYQWAEIVSHIEEPKRISKTRDLFAVPELEF